MPPSSSPISKGLLITNFLFIALSIAVLLKAISLAGDFIPNIFNLVFGPNTLDIAIDISTYLSILIILLLLIFRLNFKPRISTINNQLKRSPKELEFQRNLQKMVLLACVITIILHDFIPFFFLNSLTIIPPKSLSTFILRNIEPIKSLLIGVSANISIMHNTRLFGFNRFEFFRSPKRLDLFIFTANLVFAVGVLSGGFD